MHAIISFEKTEAGPHYDRLLERLEAMQGVQAVAINPHAGQIAVDYEPAFTNEWKIIRTIQAFHCRVLAVDTEPGDISSETPLGGVLPEGAVRPSAVIARALPPADVSQAAFPGHSVS